MSYEAGTARVTIARGAGRSQPVDAVFALELGGQRLLLAEGAHVVGRSLECDIVLDCELVSRRHAVLTVTASNVFVEDLGSVNGVTVDGHRVKGKMLVPAGAHLGFADAEVVLVQRSSRDARATARVPRQDHERSQSSVEHAATVPEAARRARAFELLTNVVDKALALGQAAEAERVIGGLLRDVLHEAEVRQALPSGIEETAARQSLRLAAASGSSEWANYSVRLYLALHAVLPLPLIDRLYSLARGTAELDPALVRRYAEALEGKQLAPTDRFALQRLRSLERMLATRVR